MLVAKKETTASKIVVQGKAGRRFLMLVVGYRVVGAGTDQLLHDRYSISVMSKC
jgi:hypothetical protein